MRQYRLHIVPSLNEEETLERLAHDRSRTARQRAEFFVRDTSRRHHARHSHNAQESSDGRS